jgi:hypothetical protein
MTSPAARRGTLFEKLLIGVRGGLSSRMSLLGMKGRSPGKIVACVFSVGERTEGLCLSSIGRQRLPVERIELIKDVSPISRASNLVFERAGDADHVLWVDADMILFEDCTTKLASLARPDALYCVAPLLDPVFGKVGYIKLLNMRLARELEIRFRDVLGCDKDFCAQAGEKNGKILVENFALPRRALGIHHPTYTARELFRKNQVERKKRGNVIDRKVLSNLIQLYSKTKSPVLLAGIIGELLPNPDASPGESGPGSGLDLWEGLTDFIEGVPGDPEFGFTPQIHPEFAKYLT